MYALKRSGNTFKRRHLRTEKNIFALKDFFLIIHKFIISRQWERSQPAGTAAQLPPKRHTNMPTRQNPGTRRSSRQRGIAHNLLELTDSSNQKPATKAPAIKKSSALIKVTAQKSRKSLEEEEFVPDDDNSTEDEEEVSVEVVSNKPHPSKNYTKPDLYERWKKAGTELAESKGLCAELNKQLKTLNRRIAFLQKEVERTETLENKVSSLQDKLVAANDKASTVSTSKTVSNAVIKKLQDSMKATYDNLCSKKDFEHKSDLCELKLKFKETELKYKTIEDENKKLKDEIQNLKKTTTSINELKVASLKSEIQIRTMEDKSNLK